MAASDQEYIDADAFRLLREQYRKEVTEAFERYASRLDECAPMLARGNRDFIASVCARLVETCEAEFKVALDRFQSGVRQASYVRLNNGGNDQ